MMESVMDGQIKRFLSFNDVLEDLKYFKLLKKKQSKNLNLWSDGFDFKDYLYSEQNMFFPTTSEM